jgi:DNA-directed RNA polymerase subunit RPC12/RpoP
MEDYEIIGPNRIKCLLCGAKFTYVVINDSGGRFDESVVCPRCQHEMFIIRTAGSVRTSLIDPE